MKKTALVTGGTRGIGLGIATELARTGFTMVVNGIRDEPEVSRTLDHLRSFGQEVYYIRGDISLTGERESLFHRALEAAGQLNILVNNAGVAPLERKDLLETSEESFDRVMGINLRGPFFLTQLVAGYLVDKKRKDPGFEACIINISSISATVASVSRGEYCISKAGVSMATRLWATRFWSASIWATGNGARGNDRHTECGSARRRSSWWLGIFPWWRTATWSWRLGGSRWISSAWRTG